MEIYGKLKDYKGENDDTNVPKGYPENPSIGRWVASQKTAYKKGKSAQAKINLLEKIGFEWKLK